MPEQKPPEPSKPPESAPSDLTALQNHILKLEKQILDLGSNLEKSESEKAAQKGFIEKAIDELKKELAALKPAAPPAPTPKPANKEEANGSFWDVLRS